VIESWCGIDQANWVCGGSFVRASHFILALALLGLGVALWIHHGDKSVDKYSWLKERDTPRVLEFLRQENARTESALADTGELQRQLLGEMKSRILPDDSSVPVKFGPFYYSYRFEGQNEYPIHVRRTEKKTVAEEILIDENQLAKGHDFFDMAGPVVSPDHTVVAYATDTQGRRFYDIHFKDLRTGEVLKDKIENTTGNMVWAADSKTLFLSKQHPVTLRSYQIYRYVLGGAAPELVYEEPDETFSTHLSGSKGSERIFIYLGSTNSTEILWLDGHSPAGSFQMFQPRENLHEYFVVFAGDRYFIMTNWQARNFRVMETSIENTEKSYWREVIPHREDVLIEDLDPYQDYLALQIRKEGLRQIEVLSRKTRSLDSVQFPDHAYVADLRHLPEYADPVFRISYQSLVRPPTVYDYRMDVGKMEFRKEKKIPGYDSSKRVTERIWARGSDGVQIPISIVYSKSFKKDGTRPLLIYGYGAYGFPSEPWFIRNEQSLLDRGFAYAIAHVRGGSEMGRNWYENGRMLAKKNSFTDFIACAEHLIENNFTSKDHLYMNGGSAGGLLVGAVMNLRPDLFNGAVAEVPFVDVLNTMLDDSLPLTTSEYDEWGNPHKKAYYDYIKSYSPYDNVSARAYPHLLTITGYHDSQVQYWEPAKWIAKLRELRTDQGMNLLYTELSAGHSGASGRYEELKTEALKFAFLLKLEALRQ